jgi:hypothetical protein
MNIVLTEYCSPLGSKSRNRIGPHAIICFCFYLHPRIQTKNTEASIFSLRYILADIISFVLNNGLLPSFTSTKTPFSNLIVSFSPCTRSAGTSSTSPRSGSGRSTPARSSSSAPWSRSTCSLTYFASCLVPCWAHAPPRGRHPGRRHCWGLVLKCYELRTRQHRKC